MCRCGWTFLPPSKATEEVAQQCLRSGFTTPREAEIIGCFLTQADWDESCLAFLSSTTVRTLKIESTPFSLASRSKSPWTPADLHTCTASSSRESSKGSSEDGGSRSINLPRLGKSAGFLSVGTQRLTRWISAVKSQGRQLMIQISTVWSSLSKSPNYYSTITEVHYLQKPRLLLARSLISCFTISNSKRFMLCCGCWSNNVSA